ncbi:MAG TPA: FHA domain-containing protein [Polyangiaceae bacterium]|nr:FHA domain-containing protein [Polyangiaceae bacterium]
MRNLESKEQCVLAPDHLIGRSPRAALCLNHSYVSAQHASIRWTGKQWAIRDLGSRNGTHVDGEALEPGTLRLLSRGARIAFGRPEQTWELVEDAGPGAVVTALDGAEEPIVIEHDLLPLPSAEQPSVTIFRRADGTWKMEWEDGVQTLVDGQVLEVLGRRWRFNCPRVESRTTTIDWPHAAQIDLQLLSVSFRVSADEEHVELRLDTRNGEVDLGSRAHNYLLLHLARQRLSEEAQGIANTASGWLHREQLISALRTDRERINLDVFRIRKQFALAGVRDANHIIERRADTGQLRIGVGRISIERV